MGGLRPAQGGRMEIDRILEELDEAFANLDVSRLPHEAQELLIEQLDNLVESLTRELRKRGALE
jgi:hypothetical protein